MRIWHQSFTVLEDVPHYRRALEDHIAAVVAPATEVVLHGMEPGTYPSAYPGTHIKYGYLAGMHREQFVRAALRAQDEGYDAMFIATIPDTGYEECRSLVDIPVVALGQTSVLMAGMLGEQVGIVNFIPELEPQLRRNFRNYGLGELVGPILQVPVGFDDVMAAFADPGPVLAAFRATVARAAAAGARVIVPGEAPLNVFLASQGVSSVDGVPVLDSLGTCVQVAELRARQYRSAGLVASRVGFFDEQPPRGMVDAVRAFYDPAREV